MRWSANLLRLFWRQSEPERGLPMPFEIESGHGFIDSVEVSPSTIVRAFGWFVGERLPMLYLSTSSGRRLETLSVARMLRPDVVRARWSNDSFCGFRADFLMGSGEHPEGLFAGAKLLYRVHCDAGCASVEPHYSHLLRETRVLGRDDIYGSGVPVDVADELKTFANIVSGHVLDFGAGNGDLVVHLVARGVDAIGLELDEPRISDILGPERRARIRLYPGQVPLPFPDRTFDWIVSTEVIEHVTDIERYVPELARILKPGGGLLVTTPDITSIPSSFLTGTVPWHLLEATHVNFFTPLSLRNLFGAHFAVVAIHDLAGHHVNGFYIPGSIGAVFHKLDQ